MKPGILDKAKWSAKTAALVQRICNRKEGVPLGIALLFYNPMASDEEKWNFVIELASDPNEPMPDEERERLTACFEYIMEGVRRIYEKGVPDDSEMEQFTVRGDLH
jgi:hypothetical protein